MEWKQLAMPEPVEVRTEGSVLGGTACYSVLLLEKCEHVPVVSPSILRH